VVRPRPCAAVLRMSKSNHSHRRHRVVIACRPSTRSRARLPIRSQSASPSDIEGGTMFATSCGFLSRKRRRRAAGKGPQLARHDAQRPISSWSGSRKGKPLRLCPPSEALFGGARIMAILAYIRNLEE